MGASKKQKKNKPKYNMFQNTWFMIKVAWKAKEKKVIILCILSALLFVGNNLINLYFAPSVLGVIETNGSMEQMLKTIIAFILGLMLIGGLNTYINANTRYGRASTRYYLLSLINEKEANTSYCNLLDEEFRMRSLQAREQCFYAGGATETFWDTIATLLLNVLGFIAYVSLLSTFNLILLLAILLTTVIGFFINRYASSYNYRHRDEESIVYQKCWYATMIAPRQSAIKDVRVFGLKLWLQEILIKSINLAKKHEKGRLKSQLWAGIIDIILVFLRNGLAYAYLINLVIKGDISAAQFLLYFAVVGEFSNWVNGIFYHFNDLRYKSLEISNVRDCLEFKEPYKFEDGKELSFNRNEKYELELVNVSYCYPQAESNTLSNIKLKIKPGEKIAIVGLNGAGKTTLVKIICGLLDPTEGKVLLNGIDIREYNRTHYYKMFSTIFQDFFILPGTISTNVAQSLTQVDFERVKECIDKAGLKDKIEKLPLKYDTLLEREVHREAIELSGGETQRLMLARALYKDAPFIILDEPTAALDPIAESEIYNKYNEMTLNKSSFYISHRLASTRFCDRILLINDSIIYEEGTHDELIKLNGKYAELFAIQSKYYQEGVDDNEEN